MNQVHAWLSLMGYSLVFSFVSVVSSLELVYATVLVNKLTIPGDTTDLFPLNGGSGGANINRLGMFSDLYYDRSNNIYYGLSDRGPGGGVISYQTRVQKFFLDVNPNTGAISNFTIKETILFTKEGQNFNGLNPQLLNGNVSTLGLSFDPEGFVVAPNGNFYVSDEYGPSVYEFRPDGSFIRAFSTPNNLIPKQSDGVINYVEGRPTITTGRQDNRGFEGVTLSPDGSKLFALLQDPLVNEGSPDGRRSRNLRLVEFDTITGESIAQYIYQLETLAEINNRVPEETFGANSQGRNIGISAITALSDREFLVLERDNRGLGVEDPLGNTVVSSKRVYKIDLVGATDVSSISLAGVNDLPLGITPVRKSPDPFLDIAAALQGQIIPEKFEGLAIGPRLNNGDYIILLGTDNDYSVTQTGSGTQFDVCTNDSQVPIDSGCPTGSTLIPGYLYSFRVDVPEPTTTTGLMLVSLGGLWLKRRRQQ